MIEKKNSSAQADDALVHATFRKEKARLFCLAPMMNRTDRHFRYLVRLLSRHTYLYTEMVVARALMRGNPERLLRYSPFEKPVALQVGGSTPAELAFAARVAESMGYDEINLNVGCPSARVRSGRMGACLMANPDLVGECVASMKAATAIPVTVKTRNGIDTQDNFQFLYRFVDTVRVAGAASIAIHARIAWLKGLDPKQNRRIPPLRYERVFQIKSAFPDTEIVINGGIESLDAARRYLTRVDGVMVGRAAYDNPRMLLDVDHEIYDEDNSTLDISAVIRSYLTYVDQQRRNGVPLKVMLRHLAGLYARLPDGRRTRRELAQLAPTAPIDRVARIALFPWLSNRDAA